MINIEVDTNIDRQSIEKSFKLPNIKEAFKVLLDTGIIKQKETQQEIYEFSFQQI